MSISTDTIRRAFERDQKDRSTDLDKDSDGHYLDTFTIGLHGIYERAYKQGQRDLIEAMNGRTLHTKLIEDGKPIFIFPEDTPKANSIVDINVTGANPSKAYRLSYLQNGPEGKTK